MKETGQERRKRCKKGGRKRERGHERKRCKEGGRKRDRKGSKKKEMRKRR